MFGLGTLGLFLGAFSGRDNSPPPEGMKWLFLAILILGSAWNWYCVARLKRVRIDGSNLCISNFFKEVRIPLDSIRGVTENRWLNLHPVTIHFRSPTPFGNSIVFMPKLRLLGWRSHPVVAELKELAHLDPY